MSLKQLHEFASGFTLLVRTARRSNNSPADFPPPDREHIRPTDPVQQPLTAENTIEISTAFQTLPGSNFTTNGAGIVPDTAPRVCLAGGSKMRHCSRLLWSQLGAPGVIMNLTGFLKLADAFKFCGAVGAVLLIVYPIDQSDTKYNLALRIAFEHKAFIGFVLLFLFFSHYILWTSKRILSDASYLISEAVEALGSQRYCAGTFALLGVITFALSSGLLFSTLLQFSFVEIRAVKLAPNAVRQKLVTEAGNHEKNGAMSGALASYAKIKFMFPHDPRNSFIDEKINELNQLISLSKMLTTNAEQSSQSGERNAAGLYAAALTIWPENERASTQLAVFRTEFSGARGLLAELYHACGDMNAARIGAAFSIVGSYFFHKSDALNITQGLARKETEDVAKEKACDSVASSKSADEFIKQVSKRLFGDSQ